MSNSTQRDTSTITDQLEKTARQVRDAMWRLIDPRGGILNDPDVEEEFEYFLTKLYREVMIVLDYLDLARSRADLERAWEGKVYDYLDAVIDGIRAIDPTRARDKT
jgi:hypothetical protein